MTDLEFKQFFGGRRLEILVNEKSLVKKARITQAIAYAYLNVGLQQRTRAKITEGTEMNATQGQAAHPLGWRRRKTSAAGSKGSRGACQKVRRP